MRLLLTLFLLIQLCFASKEDAHFVCEGQEAHYEFFISADKSATLYHVTHQYSTISHATILSSLYTKLGFHYQSKNIQIIGILDQAILYDQKKDQTTLCQLEKSAGHDYKALTNPSIEFQANLYSLGGKVRAGAGTTYEQVDSISHHTPITRYVKTSKFLDGYPWFYIEYGNNKSGYQWGGILCSKSEQIKGVYHSCE